MSCDANAIGLTSVTHDEKIETAKRSEKSQIAREQQWSGRKGHSRSSDTALFDRRYIIVVFTTN